MRNIIIKLFFVTSWIYASIGYSNWATEIVDNQARQYQQISLSKDNNNALHSAYLAYTDTSTPNKVAFHVTDTMQNMEIGIVPADTKIVMDTHHGVHAAFIRKTDDGLHELVYLSTQTNWTETVIEQWHNYNGDYNDQPSFNLQIDSLNDLHILLTKGREEKNGRSRVEYLTYKNGLWEKELVYEASKACKFHCQFINAFSLRIDSNNHAHLLINETKMALRLNYPGGWSYNHKVNSTTYYYNNTDGEWKKSKLTNTYYNRQLLLDANNNVRIISIDANDGAVHELQKQSGIIQWQDTIILTKTAFIDAITKRGDYIKVYLDADNHYHFTYQTYIDEIQDGDYIKFQYDMHYLSNTSGDWLDEIYDRNTRWWLEKTLPDHNAIYIENGVIYLLYSRYSIENQTYELILGMKTT